MTRKSLLESIKQNMPKGLTDIEKARYIYIELGKQRNFDARYFYGNTKIRKKIYRLAEEAKINPQKFHERKTLICVSLSYLYQSILKEFGIECDVILDEGYDDGHLMPVLRIQENGNGEKIRRIRADLQVDLNRIQAKMKTREFGTKSNDYFQYDVLSQEELKQIDRKIGYIKDDYKDTDIEEIGKELQDMSAADCLRFILQNPRLYRGVNFQGPVERRKYYNEVISKLTKKYINKKIYIFTCYREKENERRPGETKRDYTLLAYSYDKEELVPYLYSERDERFIPVTIQKLAELQEEGLVFGTRGHINGVKILEKAIEKNTQSRTNEKTEHEQTGDNR